MRIAPLTPGEETRYARAVEAGLLAQERLAEVTGTSHVAAEPPTAETIESDTTDTDLLHAIIAEGQRAKETMTLANLGLVRIIAVEQARRTGRPATDLFQEGCCGLAQAIIHYDHRLGRFGAYARWWIRSAMRYKHTLEQASETIGATLTDNTPEQTINRDFLRSDLVDLIATLTPDEKTVILTHHGWHDHPISLKETAHRMNLSLAKVRRLETAGLARLRDALLE
jgi:RNA polymerase sigma factor (sigma-70 family)